MPKVKHKGITIHFIEGKGWLVQARIRPRYYPTLAAARKAVDKWEHRQYKKDRRKF